MPYIFHMKGGAGLMFKDSDYSQEHLADMLRDSESVIELDTVTDKRVLVRVQAVDYVQVITDQEMEEFKQMQAAKKKSEDEQAKAEAEAQAAGTFIERPKGVIMQIPSGKRRG